MGMPSAEEMARNMDSVYEKYGLSNVIGGVDGYHIPFLERQRNLPWSHVAFYKPERILLDKFTDYLRNE